MAIVTTKAIILSSLKYGDSSLIVKGFTEKEGVKSYLIRGVLKPKKKGLKAAYFQPLTQLKIVASHNLKSNLHNIKEAQVNNPYKTIYSDIVKQSIVMFLSEVLSSSIQEEEENTALYAYLENAFIWLDFNNKTANFHLLFLLNLTHFLGFYPDVTDKNLDGFDLFEGRFTTSISHKNVITGAELSLLKRLIGIDFDAIENMSFSKNERQQLLQTIIRYFELHLEGFRTPKSLKILETVFS